MGNVNKWYPPGQDKGHGEGKLEQSKKLENKKIIPFQIKVYSNISLLYPVI